MRKGKALWLLNPVLAILLMTQMISGIFGASLPHRVFQILHKGGGVVLFVVAVVHIVLNWGWVRTMYLRRTSA